MEGQNILEISGLTIAFGEGNPAVSDVHFSVAKGEIVGIVGESGSGKSVSCLSIMRLLPKTAKVDGHIVLKGKQVLEAGEEEIVAMRGKVVSMIFQEPMSSLNPSHRCGHQVREAILIHQKMDKKSADQRVMQLFEDVLLTDVESIYHAYPHELSGGQAQRVMIAMALANQPDLIIADEPTTALDVTVQKGIIDLLRSINKQKGTSIIFISHDLGVVGALVDRVVVMQKGKVVESGSVSQVFDQPAHAYTQGLIACRPPLRYRLHRLPTVQKMISLSEEERRTYLSGLAAENGEFEKRLSALKKTDPFIRVEKLTKNYVRSRNFWGRSTNVVQALRGVDFEIKKGETLGLVGESGSGKSTCGKCLLRLIDPTAGSVFINDTDFLKLDKKELRAWRKKVQIVFQDPYSSLNPRMKIGEAIMEPLEIHHLIGGKKERKERVVQLLEKVGLEADHFDRYPHQFSGGQRQRISIARTLAVEPEFIVLDECVSALDVSVQAQILNLLLDLKQDFGLSYLFISHDISVVKFFCDGVIVMKDGEIVERGSAESIYQSPQHPYTQQLISAVYDI